MVASELDFGELEEAACFSSVFRRLSGCYMSIWELSEERRYRRAAVLSDGCSVRLLVASMFAGDFDILLCLSLI